jgi:hypothetical protein
MTAWIFGRPHSPLATMSEENPTDNKDKQYPGSDVGEDDPVPQTPAGTCAWQDTIRCPLLGGGVLRWARSIDSGELDGHEITFRQSFLQAHRDENDRQD